MNFSLRVIADVASLQGEHRERGISRYSESVLIELLRNPDVELICRLHPLMSGIRIGHPLEQRIASDRQIEEKLDLESRVPTVYLLTSPFESVPRPEALLPDWFNNFRIPLVSIVYDLIPRLFPDIYLRTEASRRWYDTRESILKCSDSLLAISDSTRRDTIRELGLHGRSITTIGTGVDLSFFCPDTSASLKTARSSVVCVAGYEPRKNVPRLIEAWALLPSRVRDRHQLLIVCSLPESGRKEWEDIAHHHHIRKEEVLFTGRISDVELRNMYRSAKLVVAPYIYEGFGLPVAEAACCGAPVICSDRSSLPEILNNPDSLFDPTNVKSIAQKLGHALTDDRFLFDLRTISLQRGPSHNWQSVTEKAVTAMKRVARVPRKSKPTSKTLLFVTPIVPSLSGVAIYSSAVISALQTDLQVTVVEDNSPSEPRLAHERPGMLRVKQLKEKFKERPLQPALVALGNSDYHMDSLDFALNNSVNLWLHDLVLTGLVTSRARRFPDVGRRIDWINGLLAAGAMGARPLEVDRSNYLDDAQYRERGIRFIEPLLARARKVIVNSEHARNIVLSTGLVDPEYVRVIRHAYRQPPIKLERTVSPTIVSMGWVGPLKRPRTLIEAMVFLDSEVKLVFAGPVDHSYEAELRQFARQLGVADRLHFTGALNDNEYWEWCGRGWVGVQLREGSNAESSGAVADLMSTGTPLVTDLPTASEIEPTAIVKIEQGEKPELVGRVLQQLIYNPEHRKALGSNASRVALAWNYHSVAAAVTDFLI